MLALLGPRCPDRLRLFLLTLAIVDDIGAITVIALFYTDDLRRRRALAWRPCWWPCWLRSALGRGCGGCSAYVRRRHRPVAGGAGVRACTRRWPASSSGCCSDPAAGPERGRAHAQYARALAGGTATPSGPGSAALAASCDRVPGERLQLALHRWTAYVVVPLFALANAGVPLDAETLRAAATVPGDHRGRRSRCVVGKAVGITAGTAVALRLGLACSPAACAGRSCMAGATLAGIGFTIALFITDLAFDDPALREQATSASWPDRCWPRRSLECPLRVLGERCGVCAPPGEEADRCRRCRPRPWVRSPPLTPAHASPRSTPRRSERRRRGRCSAGRR